jgi:predicted metal-binding membrane protein
MHCTHCCAGLTAILLVVGVMDWRAMALVTIAITLERLAPAGQQIARAFGMFLIVTGSLLIVRAGALG